MKPLLAAVIAGAAAVGLLLYWQRRRIGKRSDAERQKLVSGLCAAARSGDVDSIRSILEDGIIAADDAVTAGGETAAMWAADNGNVEVMRVLLSYGANPLLPHAASQGMTPLHFAAANGRSAVLRVLLEAAGTNRVDVRMGNGNTPLMLASRRGDADAVRVLLSRGANVNAHREDGASALLLASRENHRDVIQLLCDHGARVNDTMAENGVNALVAAVRHDFARATSELLRQGADVAHRTRDGRTALIVAAQHHSIRSAPFLIEAGVSLDEFMVGPLPIARLTHTVNQPAEWYLLLVAYDAVARQADGVWNPLFVASHRRDLDMIRLLVRGGATIDQKNTRGSTPLMLAAAAGFRDVVCELVSLGAQVDATESITGLTALHYAAAGGHVAVCRDLLQYGSDVNARQCVVWDRGPSSSASFPAHQGWTPLFWAADRGCGDLVRLLRERGGDVHMCDGRGRSVLDVARESVRRRRALSRDDHDAEEADPCVAELVEAGGLTGDAEAMLATVSDADAAAAVGATLGAQ